MASSVRDHPRPPYAPFQALDWRGKGIGVAGAIAAVIAFGFVSVSIRMVGGGSGWPLHDALHPLLGLLLGPVYGPISSVVGAAMSEVITPYTSLNGLSPLLGGISALTTGLFVRGGRAWWGLWTVVFVLVSGLLVAGSVRDPAVVLSSPEAFLSIGMLLVTSIPSVRPWARRHLAPSKGDWPTAEALYVVSTFGSTFGLFFLCAGSSLALGTAPFDTGPSSDIWFLLERALLPLLSVLLGMALWPALQRRLFSVANQLRYGLPLFIVATFFFAGRLFMERAYTTTQRQTKERLQEQSRAAARTLTTKLDHAEEMLRLQSSTGALSGPSTALFWRTERVPDVSTLPPDVQSLVGRARSTNRPQRGLVTLPDTTARSVALVLPSNREERSVSSGLLAYVAPAALQRTLAAWNQGSDHLYLINENQELILSVSADQSEGAPDTPRSLVNALLAPPHSTAEASQGLHGTNVIGAIAPVEGLPGHVVMEQDRAQAYLHVFEMLLSMAFIVLLTGGGALAVGFYVSRRVVTPLDRLIEAARRVGTGDLSTQVTVEQDNELGELATTFNAMTEELSASIQRLQTNEERLRLALDAAQMGTWNWTTEPEETVTWSPQTYSILGVPKSRTDDLQEVFLARVHPDDRDRVLEEIQSVFEDETGFSIEHRIRPRKEGIRWVRLRGRVFRDEEGQPQRLSGIIMDITARKEAEHELRVAKEEAEEMSRLKSAFLANVSHEIRTPLTSIIGFAEILADEVPEEQRDQAEKIVMSGRRLMKTLDSVLDLSMIEAGEFSLQCRSFDFAEEVRQRADLLRPMAEQKDLDFTIDVPDECAEVRLDPNCLDRILTNLVTNAIKFTNEGYIAVRVQTTPSSTILQVEDSGVGIDEAFLPELFEAFKQESVGLQREHQGTGLGLSITKELVELMDGEIEVDSQKGEGTVFTVRLPYHATSETEPVLR